MNSDVKDSFLVSLVSVLTPMGTWQDTILNFFVTIILKMFTGLPLGLVAVHGLFSCGTTAQLLHGLWSLSSLTSGIEPVSPAAQAGLLATGRPGSPCIIMAKSSESDRPGFQPQPWWISLHVSP